MLDKATNVGNDSPSGISEPMELRASKPLYCLEPNFKTLPNFRKSL